LSIGDGGTLNPLEEWIHRRIRREVEGSSEFQKQLGKKRLEIVTRDELTGFWLYKLRQVLNYVHERSPFYRRLFRNTGVDPKDISSIQDFYRIPFTELKNISENPYQFLCVSQSKILRGFTVEEFFEPVRRIFFTENEIKGIVEAVAVGLRTVGLKTGGVVQIVFPWEPKWGLPDIVERGVKAVGGKPVFKGALTFERQINEIEKNNPSMIIGPNPYLRELTDWAKNRFDLGSLGVETLVLSRGCDFFPFDESIRKELEGLWQCRVYDHYGITEASFALAIECCEQSGLHLNEFDAYVEVVDPHSGENVDVGEEGELVFTTLNRRGMPLIRCRSRDFATVIDGPCGCGARESRRITGIKRNIEEVL